MSWSIISSNSLGHRLSATGGDLEQGDWTARADALRLVEPLRRVPVTEDVVNVSRCRDVQARLVPVNLAGDALHLAIPCVFDFLLTWNIRHLANPNKLTASDRRQPASGSLDTADRATPPVQALSGAVD